MPAYVKYIGLSVLFLLATVNFTRTTLEVIESSKRLDEVRSGVVQLEEDKVSLENELEYRKSPDYIEKEARNKLGLVKPGEQLFVTSNVLGSASYKNLDTVNSFERTNISMWADLFF